MQVGPSSNVLDALSQLQGVKPPPQRGVGPAIQEAIINRASSVALQAGIAKPSDAARPLATSPATSLGVNSSALSSLPPANQGTVAKVEHPDFPVLGRYINILV